MDESYVTDVNYTEFMQKYRSRRFTKRNGFPIKPIVIEIGTSDKDKNIDISLIKNMPFYSSELLGYIEKVGKYFDTLSKFPLEWIVTSNDLAIPVNDEDKGFIRSMFNQTSERYGVERGLLDLTLIGVPRVEVTDMEKDKITPYFNLDSFRNLMANYPIFSDKELIASANIIQGYLRLDKELIKNDLIKAYPSKKIGNWEF